MLSLLGPGLDAELRTVRSLGQWAAATCAAPPSVNAGQCASSNNC